MAGRFQRIVSLVRIILRVFAISQSRRVEDVARCKRVLPSSKRPTTLLDLSQPGTKHKIEEKIQQSSRIQPHDLAVEESEEASALSEQAGRILSSPPWTRTIGQIEQVHLELQCCHTFREYPSHVQASLCKVGWYQRYGPGRVILREGHPASCFYLILSGNVTETKDDELINNLIDGDSFGDVAIIECSNQNTSYICATNTELFSISKSDYLDLSLRQARQSYQRTKHFTFCKTIGILKLWPLNTLQSTPEACQVAYYKPNAIVVKDSLKSEWVYVVMTGSCRVVKRFVDCNDRLESGQRRRTLPGAIRQTSQLALAGEGVHNPSSAAKAPGRRSVPAMLGAQELLDGVASDKGHTGLHPSHSILSEKVKKQFLVQLQLLQPKDVFGLSSLVYKDEPSVSLVSNGADLVLISRRFIKENFDESIENKLKKQVVQFPSQDAMLKRIREHHIRSTHKQSMMKHTRRKT